jgi:hypothetical protein
VYVWICVFVYSCESSDRYMYISVCVNIYIYIYIYTYIYTHQYIYIYLQHQLCREDEESMRERRDAMTKRIMELGGHIKTMRAQGADR